MAEEPPKRFERVREQAHAVVESPSRMRRLAEQTADKLDGVTGGKFAQLRLQVETGLALLRDYLAGDYREVSNSTLVALVASLMYFVMPFDAIPDFLFGWGFLDDAAVLGFVFTQIREELERYARWRESRVADTTANTPFDSGETSPNDANTPADARQARTDNGALKRGSDEQHEN